MEKPEEKIIASQTVDAATYSVASGAGRGNISDSNLLHEVSLHDEAISGNETSLAATLLNYMPEHDQPASASDASMSDDDDDDDDNYDDIFTSFEKQRDCWICGERSCKCCRQCVRGSQGLSLSKVMCYQ